MPGPLIVGAEGVILQPDDAYASSRPILEGLELVLMMEKFPTSQLTVVCNTDDQTAAEYFVKMNGLPKARIVLTAVEDEELPTADAQWHTIQRERAKGPLNYVLTAYKQVYTHCVQTHQAALLFGRKGALSTMETAPSWEELHDRVKMTKEARLGDVPEDYSNRSEGF